jgi:hypothetical protein
MNSCEKEHDFHPPVVIKGIFKSWTFFFSDKVEREVVWTICRKCGKQYWYGWIGESDE